jgi:hypothetical protein
MWIILLQECIYHLVFFNYVYTIVFFRFPFFYIVSGSLSYHDVMQGVEVVYVVESLRLESRVRRMMIFGLINYIVRLIKIDPTSVSC